MSCKQPNACESLLWLCRHTTSPSWEAEQSTESITASCSAGIATPIATLSVGGNPLGSTSNGSYPAITTQVLSGAHQHKNFGSKEKRKAVIFLKQKTQESGMALMYLMKPAPVWLACNCSSKGSAEKAKLPDFAAFFHRTYDFQSEVAFLPCLIDSFFFKRVL